MKKGKLTVFDLVEGKTYTAFDKDGNEVGRKFRIANGKLQNDQGQGPKMYQDCAWVPMNADVTFKEEGDSDHAISVVSLLEGRVYENSTVGRIARKGSTLFAVSGTKATKKLPLSNISLNLLFVPVGKLSASKKKTSRASARR